MAMDVAATDADTATAMDLLGVTAKRVCGDCAGLMQIATGRSRSKNLPPGADHKVRRIMTRYDAKGDGKVTKDEFAKSPRRRFTTREINGDGTTSDDELPTGCGKRGDAATQRGEAGNQAVSAGQGKG